MRRGLVAELSGQHTFERVFAALQPCLDRAFGGTQLRRDLGLRLLLDIAPYEHIPHVRRQQSQSALNQPGQLVALELELQIEVARETRIAFPALGVLDLDGAPELAVALAGPHQALVTRDTEQPTASRLWIAQLLLVLPGA